MKTLFTLLVSFYSLAVFAQVPEPNVLWLTGYGGNSSVLPYVTNTNDGGFIIGIQATSNDGNIDSLCVMSGDRVIFLKYNAAASSLEWSNCSTEGTFIYPQNDGSFVFGGITNAVPAGWAFKILREDALGTILWRKTYGGEAAGARLFDMIATTDGGYIMMGETNYTDTDFTIHYDSSAYDDIAVIKLDSNGNKVWAEVIGGTNENASIAVVPAPDDGIPQPVCNWICRQAFTC